MPRSQGSDTLTVGGLAPDFALAVAGEDRTVQLGDYRDRRLLLVFVRHAW